MRLLQFTLLVLTICIPAFASSGDRSADFGGCLHRCGATHCQPSRSSPLPFALRLTHWSCTDDCKYICMHQITDRDVGHGDKMQQYYGKWPFWRLGGMQEPASVAFSLLNLWFHVEGAMKVQQKIPNGHPMKPYYITWAYVSVNAWVWSSVFHARDKPVTEKLDYFSAALAILYALYYTVIRMFHLYSPSQCNRLTGWLDISSAHNTPRKVWSIACVLLYLAHISYLSLLSRFDYSYNMAFNLILGLTHNFLWLIYSMPPSLSFMRRFPYQPISYRPHFVGKAAIFVALTTAATALELFDFPPWGRVIDAHSLWHLSTAPIVVFWYDFLIEDALDGSWRGHRI